MNPFAIFGLFMMSLVFGIATIGLVIYYAVTSKNYKRDIVIGIIISSLLYIITSLASIFIIS